MQVAAQNIQPTADPGSTSTDNDPANSTSPSLTPSSLPDSGSIRHSRLPRPVLSANHLPSHSNNALNAAVGSPHASTSESLSFYKDRSFSTGSSSLTNSSYINSHGQVAAATRNFSDSSPSALTRAAPGFGPSASASSPSLKSPGSAGERGQELAKKSSVQDLVAKFDSPVEMIHPPPLPVLPRVTSHAIPIPTGRASRSPGPQASRYKSKSPAGTRRRPLSTTRGIKSAESEVAPAGEANITLNSPNGSLQRPNIPDSRTNGSLSSPPSHNHLQQHHHPHNHHQHPASSGQSRHHSRRPSASQQHQQQYQRPLFGEVDSSPETTFRGPGHGISPNKDAGHNVRDTSASQQGRYLSNDYAEERASSRGSNQHSPTRQSRSSRDADTRAYHDRPAVHQRPVTPTNQVPDLSAYATPEQTHQQTSRYRAVVETPNAKPSPTLRSSRPRQQVSNATSPVRSRNELYTEDGMSPVKKPYSNVRDMDMPTRRDSIRKALRAHSSQMSMDELALTQSMKRHSEIPDLTIYQADGATESTAKNASKTSATGTSSSIRPMSMFAKPELQKLRTDVDREQELAGEAPPTAITEFEDDESPVLGIPGSFPTEHSRPPSSEPRARISEQPVGLDEEATSPGGDLPTPTNNTSTDRFAQLVNNLDAQALASDEAGTIQIVLSQSPAVGRDSAGWHPRDLHRPATADEASSQTMVNRESLRSDDSNARPRSASSSFHSDADRDSYYSVLHRILADYRDSRSLTNEMILQFHQQLLQVDPELAQRPDIDSMIVARNTLQQFIVDADSTTPYDGTTEFSSPPRSSKDPFVLGQPQDGTFFDSREDSIVEVEEEESAPAGLLRSKYYTPEDSINDELTPPRQPPPPPRLAETAAQLRASFYPGEEDTTERKTNNNSRTSGRKTPQASTMEIRPMNKPSHSEVRHGEAPSPSEDSVDLDIDDKPTLPEIQTTGSFDLGKSLHLSTSPTDPAAQDTNRVSATNVDGTTSIDNWDSSSTLVPMKATVRPSSSPALSADDKSTSSSTEPGVPTPDASTADITRASSNTEAELRPSLDLSSIRKSRTVESSPATAPGSELKRLQQRRNLIKELIDTECTYSQDMKVVEDIYKGTANAVEALTLDDKKVLFGNLEQVVEFSDAFLAALKQAGAGIYTMAPSSKWRKERRSTASGESQDDSLKSSIPPAPEVPTNEGDRQTTIGDCFNKVLGQMEKVYGDYLKNHDFATQRLQKLQTIPQVKLWLNECHDYVADLTSAWDLDSLLVKPVQRILKYPLIIKSLLDVTPDDHPDQFALQTASNEIIGISRRINESKKRLELLDQVFNGNTGAKRQAIDPTLGLSKAFGRRTEKLRQQVGLSDAYDDPEYKAISEKYGGHYFQLQVIMRDFEDYKRQTGKFVKQYGSLMEAIEEVMDAGHSQHPEIECKWRKGAQVIREIGAIGWPEHSTSIQKHCVEPLRAVIKLCEAGPEKLIAKRKKRIVEYAKYMAVKAKGDKPDKKLQEQGEQFVALNDALKEELPRLYLLGSKLVVETLKHFIYLKSKWFSLWQMKLSNIVDDARETDSFVQIVEAFKEDFSHASTSVSSLRICNGSALADIASLNSATSSNDDWSSSSTKRPSMQSTGAGSLSSTTDVSSYPSNGRPYAGTSPYGTSQYGSPRASGEHQQTAMSPQQYGSSYSQQHQQLQHQRSGSAGAASSSHYVPHSAASWSNVKISSASSAQTPAGRHQHRASQDYYSSRNPPPIYTNSPNNSRTRADSYTASTPVAMSYYQQANNPAAQAYQYQQQHHRPASSSTYLSATSNGPIWQPQQLPGGNRSPDEFASQRPQRSTVFSSAMPMDDSPTQYRGPQELEGSGPGAGAAQSNHASSIFHQSRVLYLAASLYEFNIDRSRTEAGYPYLTYQPGEIFDVIAEKGEIWLARNQDDSRNTIGWIWEKHFVKLPYEEA